MTTIEKLLSFLELKAGWHFGEGETISADLIGKAFRAEQRLTALGYRATDAFPLTDGGVSLRGYWADGYVELNFEVDGTLSVWLNEHRIEYAIYEGSSFEAALGVIPDRHASSTIYRPELIAAEESPVYIIEPPQWNWSELFTSGTTIPGKNAFTAPRSSPARAYLSLTTLAPDKLPPQPVTTSPASTPPWHQSRRSLRAYPERPFQPRPQ